MKKLALAALLLASALSLGAANKTYKVTSPDGRTVVTIDGDTYQVSYDGQSIIAPSKAAMILSDGQTISPALKVRKAVVSKKPVTEHITAPFYRQAEFDFTYNSLDLQFSNGWGMLWKVTDEGAAYRFYTTASAQDVINDETVEINFANDGQSWIPYTTNPKAPYKMAFQATYAVRSLSEGTMLPGFLPATVQEGPVKVTLMESDIQAYPGMFITSKPGDTTIKGEFPHYPKTTDYYPWRHQLHVTSAEDYIAVSQGARSYPWRILAITTDDTQMPVNNMVYALAEPSRISDTAWIKPGYSAWEWWNDWSLQGVDFVAGINMDTYRYYIDFASANGLEYVILDEGWYKPSSGDMLTPIDALDIKALADYAAGKNVKLILWTVFNVLDDQLEAACQKYSEMGVAGFKVDFMDRNDQTAYEMVWRIAQKAAQYHLVLDYHGISAPVGMNRTWPNVINYEAVFGQEEVKWGEPDLDMPLYNVTFPYIRLMCGSTDYTPGAMLNATQKDYKAVYSNPTSIGTRSQQVAMYVVFDSPFTMLCDAPTRYQKEQETTDFIAAFPRCYDSEKVLQGTMGEYIVTARQAGANWYIGGMTSWTPRDIEMDFSFLPEGTYDLVMYGDGVNAGHNAQDYKITKATVTPATKMPVHMAPGGGFAMQIVKK